MSKIEIANGFFGIVLSAGFGALIGASTMASGPGYKILVRGGFTCLIIGFFGLATLFFWPKKEKQAVAEPVITTSGTTVLSIGQSGGVTAGTYVNQAVMPQFKILSNSESKNSDGTITTTISAQVVAPFTPGNLHLQINADGLVGVQIMTPPQNGVSSISLRNVLKNGNSYTADIPGPTGLYTIFVKTTAKTAIDFNSNF